MVIITLMAERECTAMYNLNPLSLSWASAINWKVLNVTTASETDSMTAGQKSNMFVPLAVLLFSTWEVKAVQVTNQTGDEVSSSLCPQHWIDASLTGLGCLYFNSSSEVTWEEAGNICQAPENDALLLEIGSELQLDFVRSELVFLQDSGLVDLTGDWWTGGTDQGRDGRWNWAGSLENVGDFVWHHIEPNGGTSENCLLLPNGYGFLGNDFPCTGNRYFICQKK